MTLLIYSFTDRKIYVRANTFFKRLMEFKLSPAGHENALQLLLI